MSMKKIALNIAEQQYDRMKALAKDRGITQSELFRRFIEEGLLREERKTSGVSRRQQRQGM
jgi:hypothetical protein